MKLYDFVAPFSELGCVSKTRLSKFWETFWLSQFFTLRKCNRPKVVGNNASTHLVHKTHAHNCSSAQHQEKANLRLSWFQWPQPQFSRSSGVLGFNQELSSRWKYDTILLNSIHKDIKTAIAFWNGILSFWLKGLDFVFHSAGLQQEKSQWQPPWNTILVEKIPQEQRVGILSNFQMSSSTKNQERPCPMVAVRWSRVFFWGGGGLFLSPTTTTTTMFDEGRVTHPGRAAEEQRGKVHHLSIKWITFCLDSVRFLFSPQFFLDSTSVIASSWELQRLVN